MNLEPSETSCRVALKEWGATVEALRLGRQIMLLRKGGIHDAGGVFALEHSRFWLLPTAFHQAKPMLKAEHADLLSAPVSDRTELRLQVLAHVGATWRVDESALEALSNGAHIWNDDYLHLRLGYKPNEPLDCVALRAYEMPTAHVVAGDPKYFGCRSWIELDAPLEMGGARPVLSDEEWEHALAGWRSLLGLSLGGGESGGREIG